MPLQWQDIRTHFFLFIIFITGLIPQIFRWTVWQPAAVWWAWYYHNDDYLWLTWPLLLSFHIIFPSFPPHSHPPLIRKGWLSIFQHGFSGWLINCLISVCGVGGSVIHTFIPSAGLFSASLWRTFCLSSDKIVELRWQMENWVTLLPVKKKRNYGKYLYAQCISPKSHPDARNCIKHVYCFTSVIIEIESVHQYIWRQWRELPSFTNSHHRFLLYLWSLKCRFQPYFLASCHFYHGFPFSDVTMVHNVNMSQLVLQLVLLLFYWFVFRFVGERIKCDCR